MSPAVSTWGSAHDFDFFFGDWTVQHRRLKERLVACTEWETFAGTTRTYSMLGGAGNCDDNYLELPGGPYRAATFRSFDQNTAQWSIWWLDGRTPGALDVPVRGKFDAGIGAFYAEDILNGKPIRVRFLWLLTDPTTPRWEQAFSADAGVTWETNWSMDFTRVC